MTNERFLEIVKESIERSNALLEVKGKEYGTEDDRLVQFKTIAALEGRLATEALFTLVAKHITSVALMVKDPLKFSDRNWDDKLDDIRNYTLLLTALLKDLKE